METESLTTLDQFGGRRFVIPAEVEGPVRTGRNRVAGVLIFVFLALPWIKLNGVQILLLDIPGRRFAIFGKLFFAHDGPLLFFIFAAAVMTLAAATSIWGRVWCGWACPQTVFIDGVYRRIEIWIEGNYIERRRLRAGGISGTRAFKITVKWLLYLIVSSVLAHSLFALFAGSDRLFAMMQGSPHDNWTYFVTISITTAVLMFNFGWFREQFCTIMCPYGRFQSVLMDDDSLNVLYDEKRGEPRKGTEGGSARGACVSCNRCVEVCPAKIDIRQGVQMECIGCTACIDACNVIMKKVNQAPNLIQYQSLNGKGVKLTNPRALTYAGVALLCLAGLLVQYFNHSPFDITLLRAKDTPYQNLPDGTVLNHFKVHLFNQSGRKQEFTVAADSDALNKGIKVTQVKPVNLLAPGENIEIHIFLTFPQSLLTAGQARLKLQFDEKLLGPTTKEVTVVGP